ncbi:NUDIX domain-containing protein [Dactylosporangium sp. CS-047395]|uniref:NUDIX domain-containing protein n=1 Tax=Dactylosporangium sp. CS-047395 TaxID=3239936 RepID=UPI003D919B6D
MTIDEDLLAEGEPEREFTPGFSAQMARKAVGGALLLRDPRDRLVFVEPIYKPTLEIPGGVAEENESPLAACRREVQEELGLDLPIGRLLVVDWTPAHGIWSDGLTFIFDGGVLPADELDRLRPGDAELRAVLPMPLDEAEPRLKPSLARRLRVAVAAARSGEGPIHTEFGRPL